MRLSQAIPAMPVSDIPAATRFYEERLGFTVVHQDEGFVVVVRDELELHLWLAGDQRWKTRTGDELARSPVRSGAESFLAGTASCRVAVDDVDGLYAQMSQSEVLHPIDRGSPVDTDHGTREFATLDLDGNLLTFFHRLPSRTSPGVNP